MSEDWQVKRERILMFPSGDHPVQIEKEVPTIVLDVNVVRKPIHFWKSPLLWILCKILERYHSN